MSGDSSSHRSATSVSTTGSLHSQLTEGTRDLAITTPSPVPGGMLSPLAAQWHTEQTQLIKGRRSKKKPDETQKEDATGSAPATVIAPDAVDTAMIQDIVAPVVAGPSDPGPRDPGAVGGMNDPPEAFIPVYSSEED